jgi:hypothetical protein
MIITREFIESGRSDRGGWNKNQVRLLGLDQWRKLMLVELTK